MIPRLPPDVVVKAETRDLILDLAENLYPGVDEIWKLDKQNRSYWLLLSSGILREYPDISHYLETLSNVLARGVNAEIDDILQRLEADLKDKQRRSEAEEREQGNRERRAEDRHQADLADQTQRRGEREERWKLEQEERRQQLEKDGKREDNGYLIEKALMAMMVVAFALAVGLLIVAALVAQSSGKPANWSDSLGWAFAAGGSGAMGLLSLVMLMLYRVMPAKKKGDSPSPGDMPASASS
jgi:hypothetical protein